MDVYGQGAAAGTAFQLADAATWLVPLIFALVVGAFIFSAVKNVSEWLSNNKKPVETEKAKVVTKREHVRRRAIAAGEVVSASDLPDIKQHIM